MPMLFVSPMSDIRQQLLRLSHGLGSELHSLAILGEGNTSARLSDDRFLVKASGTCLRTLGEADVVECDMGKILSLFEKQDCTDADIAAGLLGSRIDPSQKKPSVEALFHAYLLSLPGIKFVGHTHPVAVNAFLCSPQAPDFATTRIFPDEIVCCGDSSVLVPYTDPGLQLAVAIKEGVEAYREEFGELPRVILLENHGVITLGPSPEAVEAAMFMCEKAARIRLGAATLGGITPLTPENVRRISSRPDEHERRRSLGI